MPFKTDHIEKFQNLKAALDYKNRSQMKFAANGGNTVLFTYPPEEENLYIAQAAIELKNLSPYFIDLNDILVTFLDDIGIENLDKHFKDLKTCIDQIFKADDERKDLFDLIIEAIKTAFDNNNLPVLIHTGSLYGTGIENIHIMEHNVTMRSKTPLLVFYPAKETTGNLLFLNFKPASKYRCVVI